MRLRVAQVQYSGAQVVADFEMQGDRLVVEYHDEGFKHLFRQGIPSSVAARMVKPKDGRLFFDALEPYFVRSTTVRVFDPDK